MTEVPDRSPFTCPPAAARGLRSRGGKMRPCPDAALDHGKVCGTAAADPDELVNHSDKQSSPSMTETPLKNGKTPCHNVVTSFVDMVMQETDGEAEADSRNRGNGQRPQATGGRGRGRRVAPDMSLVRSSSRKKIKKSLGPDFLDPRELNSQMKHRMTDALKVVAETEKNHEKDVVRLRCVNCNQVDESDGNGDSSQIADKLTAVRTHEDNEMLPDTATPMTWVCSSCHESDSRTCCFCGKKDADVLCSSCEPGDRKSVHRKCIITAVSGTDPDRWKCKQCEPQTSDVVVGEKEKKEDSHVPDATDSGTSGSLVEEETKPTQCLTEIKQNADTTTEVPSIESASSDQQEPISKRRPETWSVADVVSFIESTGFASAAVKFKDQEIDGKSLLLMKRSDVITGLGLKVGVGLKLFSFINHLQTFKLVTRQQPSAPIQ